MMNLNDQNFETEIQNAKKPVLVDFWADFCQPCSVLAPILEKIVEEKKDELILAKVNLETAPLAAQKYGVDRIPLVILFKDGKPVSGFIGAKPEEEIKKWLEESLRNDEREKIGKIIEEYEEYAARNGYKLNQNREILEGLIRGLLENEKKYGFRYCPCRIVSGNSEEDKSKICPCRFISKEIEEQGHCLCGLFIKP